jgi:putative ubiquitin-RnfH superfamily antitoxin RatB of RatAB toxin-antitoxin module
MTRDPELPGVEVAYALPSRQRVVSLPLAEGMTALEAVRASGLLGEFPEIDPAALALGIWGRPVDASQRLQAGDRIEIYRPLRFDPRVARRQAAASSAQARRR